MGLFDSLFGRTEDTTGGNFTPRVDQITQQTPEQEQLLKSLLGNAQARTEGGGTIPGFQGQFTAPTSGLEQQAFGSISDLLDPSGQTQQFAQRSLRPFDQQASIDRFNQFQLPFAQSNQAESRRNILESFAGTGGFQSGDLLRSLNRGETEFNLGLQSQLGQQLNFDEQFGLNRNLAGINTIFGAQSQGLAGGAVQRQTGIGGQQDLDRILQDFLRQQQPDPALTQLAALGLGSTPSQPFENLIQIPDTTFGQSPASGIGSLLSGVGSFFS
jgi:hypothetical protein